MTVTVDAIRALPAGALLLLALLLLALFPAHAQDGGKTARLAEARGDVGRLIKRGVPKENIRIAYVIENGRLNTYAIYYTPPNAMPRVVIGDREMPADRLPGIKPGYLKLVNP